MIINGIPFKTYASDNVETVTERFAVRNLETLPKYVVFEPPLEPPFEEMPEVTAYNVLDPVIRSDDFNFPETSLNFSKVDRADAERWFVITHPILNQPGGDAFIGFVKNVKMAGVDFLWNQKDSFFKNFEKEMRAEKKKIRETEEYFDEFERIPSVGTNEFKIIRTTFTASFSTKVTTIGDLFNTIILTHTVPFANTGQFYKIHHGFSPSKDWLNLETKNVVLLKINGETDVDFKSDKKRKGYGRFTNVVATIKEGKLTMTMDSMIGPKYLSRKDFLNRLLNVFPTISIEDVEEVKDKIVIGNFIIPYQTLMIPVWAELAMNDNFFNKRVAIDEAIRASKIKQNAYMHVLNSSDILILVMKETDGPSQHGMDSEGTSYVRVRMKTSNISEALNYRDVVGKFFTLYNNKKDEILHEYRKFIPNFLKEEEMKLEKGPAPKLERMRLRTVAPEIFMPNYSRTCINRPTLVSREQADEYTRTGEKQVMVFPIYGESVERFYVCNHDTHPYPGLRENPLENKKKFPYVPCCYAKNQDKPGSKYRHYYERERIDSRQITVQEIFVSAGKNLPPGATGSLPSKLKELFSLAEVAPDSQFVRLGLNDTDESFLEAVMLATNASRLKFVEPELRIPIVREARSRLVTEANAMAAKQELTDYSLTSILGKLQKGNMNALEMIHVMEQAFDCNIFVMTVNSKESDGTMLVPPHKKTYYKLRPTRQTVFVCQTESGTDYSDTHCDLIVQIGKNEAPVLENMLTSFSPSDLIVRNVWTVFQKINKSYIKNFPIVSVALPRFYVTSQILDIYGKCRVVNVSNQGTDLTMVTDPLPPFAAERAREIYRTSIPNVLKFAKTLGAELTSQVVNEKGRVCEIEVVASKGNLSVTFLCDDPGRIENVPVSNSPKFGNLENGKKLTILESFNRNGKIAKIIIRYGLYIMSRYMHEKGLDLEPMDETQLSTFVRDRILIDPSHKYDEDCRHSSEYSMKSCFVRDETFLIVDSEETLRRLVYVLRLYQNSHFENLKNYRNKIYMDDFYESVGDFDPFPQQFIFEGEDSVINTMAGYANVESVVTDSVDPNETKPYFMRNSILSTDKTYLAQNVPNLIIAKSLARFWNEHGYNGYVMEEEQTFLEKSLNLAGSVDVYSYVDPGTIINLTYFEEPIESLVLGYLVEGAANYTTLMPV